MDLNYKSYGSGAKTIVLLHYFGGNADSWRWVVQRLQRKNSVLVITLPGFGHTKSLEEPSIFSLAKYINRCVEELNLTNYILCGHSMSGKLILYANQISLRNKAKGLVLIAPSPPTVEEMSKEDKEQMLNLPDYNTAKSLVESATFRKLKNKRLEVAIESQRQIDLKTREWWLAEGMLNDISKRISGIDTPTFVICAKKDTIIPMKTIYEEVLPHLYKPRLIQLGRCGHLIPLEAPRRLSRRISKIVDNILA